MAGWHLFPDLLLRTNWPSSAPASGSWRRVNSWPRATCNRSISGWPCNESLLQRSGATNRASKDIHSSAARVTWATIYYMIHSSEARVTWAIIYYMIYTHQQHELPEQKILHDIHSSVAWVIIATKYYMIYAHQWHGLPYGLPEQQYITWVVSARVISHYLI